MKAMKPILRDIVVDQRNFAAGRRGTVPRHFPKDYLTNEQVIIITGVRRCGKSVLLQQIRAQMPQGDYFFNFDDDRLTGFTVDNFQELYEVLIELYGEQDTFYFDEIQNVSGWEHFVRRLYNMGKKVFLTGSNAHMLSRELGTLLTGCYLAIELFPFTFGEYLSLRGFQALLPMPTGTASRGEVAGLAREYLRSGGFPLYIRTGDSLILKTLYDNILYRDVMVRNQITNEREVKELVFFMMSNIGKPFTYSSLAKAIGVKNPTTAKNYVEYIENTYLVATLKRLDDSVKEQLRSPRKAYAIDNALALQVGYHFTDEAGRLLENLVYVELRRRGAGELFFFNGGNCECDFVIRRGTKVTAAIQVSVSLAQTETRARELAGLTEAMRAFHLAEGIIVTEDSEEELDTPAGKIRIVPLWRWLLDGYC